MCPRHSTPTSITAVSQSRLLSTPSSCSGGFTYDKIVCSEYVHISKNLQKPPQILCVSYKGLRCLSRYPTRYPLLPQQNLPKKSAKKPSSPLWSRFHATRQPLAFQSCEASDDPASDSETSSSSGADFNSLASSSPSDGGSLPSLKLTC